MGPSPGRRAPGTIADAVRRLDDAGIAIDVSSAFVPVATMPSWLQPIAEHNPFTTMVDAARALFLGIPAGNSVWLASVWTIAIIGVFAPLSAWRYRRVVTR